jgi:hypothetical protein
MKGIEMSQQRHLNHTLLIALEDVDPAYSMFSTKLG